jgi:HPt (histidine-containing phosphotransfer) domain-containing protein
MARRPSTNVVNAGARAGGARRDQALIDHDHLERQTAGDVVLQHELLKLFLMQLDDIDATLSAASMVVSPKLAEQLHRIRGAAEAVGARGLAQALARAEAGCIDPAQTLTWLEPLRSQVAATRAHLSRLIAAEDRGGLAKLRESR